MGTSWDKNGQPTSKGEVVMTTHRNGPLSPSPGSGAAGEESLSEAPDYHVLKNQAQHLHEAHTTAADDQGPDYS